MHATETRGANLAVRQTPPLTPAIARRRRTVAFYEMFADASRKPSSVYALTRKEPRRKPYDEREREVIHAGIRAGQITPEGLIRYRLAQIQDDLAQFSEAPLLEELLYLQLIREEAEALDAQSRAHALPTPDSIDAAVRETEDATLVGRVFCVLARSRRTLFHGDHS